MDSLARVCDYETAPQEAVLNQEAEAPASDRSMIVMILLWLFLGGIGMHRFYAGKPGSAVGQMMLTVGAILVFIIAVVAAGSGGSVVVGWLALATNGVWLIVDFFRIITGNFRDVAGNVIRSS